VDLRLLRSEFGEDAAEAQRVFAEGGAHPVVAGGGGVAFVEDEVDDFEHGRETRGKVGPARDLEWDAGFGERALGAHDALGGRWARDEEGAGDFVGGQGRRAGAG